MLIQLTDVKGKEYWINPLYVKAIVARKAELSEIFISFGGSLSQVSSIKVKQDAAAVAQIVSDVLASMGSTFPSLVSSAEEEYATQVARQQQAAAAASSVGG